MRRATFAATVTDSAGGLSATRQGAARVWAVVAWATFALAVSAPHAARAARAAFASDSGEGVGDPAPATVTAADSATGAAPSAGETVLTTREASAEYERAEADVRAGNWADAVRRLRAVTRAMPSWPTGQVELAWALLNDANPATNLAEATRALETARRVSGHTPRFAYLEGRLAELAGDWVAADEAYARALERRADYAAAADRKKALKSHMLSSVLDAPPAAAVAVAEPVPAPAPPAPTAQSKPIRAERSRDRRKAKVAPAQPAQSAPADAAEARADSASVAAPTPHPEPGPLLARAEPPAAVAAPAKAPEPVAAQPVPEPPPPARRDVSPAASPADPPADSLPEPPVEPASSGPHASLSADARDMAQKLLDEGRALMVAGQHRAAMGPLEQAAALAPGWALPQLELVIAHFGSDNDLAAIETSLEVVKATQANNPRYWYWAGRLHEAKGEDLLALDAYTRADQARPGMLDVRRRMRDMEAVVAAAAQAGGGARGVAPTDLARHARLSSAELEALHGQIARMNLEAPAIDRARGDATEARRDYTLAMLALDEGDKPRAFALFQRAATKAPGWHRPYLEMARVELDEGGDGELVEKLLARAMTCSPDSADAQILWARLALSRGQVTPARQAFEAATELDPTRLEPRLRLADLLEQNGQTSAALDQLRRVAKDFPEQTAARLKLVMLLEGDDRDAEAERQLVSLQKKRPRDVMVLETLRAHYRRRGLAKQAAEVEKKLKTLDSAQADRKLRPLQPSKF
jgi:tetratricopeptide (TPR) repeat protein